MDNIPRKYYKACFLEVIMGLFKNLCIIGFLLVTIAPIDDVFAKNKSIDLPRCPIMMILAIMTSHPQIVQTILENGEDPNVSLDSCHFMINQEGVMTLFDENETISVSFWTTLTLTEDVLKSSSLLHLGARIRSAGRKRGIGSYIYSRMTEVCTLLIKHGADIYAVDSTGRTSLDIEIEAQFR